MQNGVCSTGKPYGVAPDVLHSERYFMQKKKSFLIYTESLSVLDELNKEQIADLFLAIKDYQNGVEPKLNGLMKAVFLPFKNYFDENAEKYEKVCKKRRNAGSLGGKANATKCKQMLPNATKCKQMRYDNDSESDSEYDSDSDVSNETLKKEISKEKTEITKGCRFENSPYFNETMPKEFETESSKMPVEENPIEEEKIQKKTARKRNAQTLFDETEFYQETIPDSLKEIAAKLNPFQNAQPTYEAFKDYNLQHARKAADWKAAWRNWLRSKYNSNFKDISHVLNREAVKNQMAYLEQMKAQGDEFFIQRARTRLKQIIEQELEK